MLLLLCLCINKKYLEKLIILSYKNFDYIYEAIDSVFKQSYPSIELIIADDCSDNYPGELLQKYIQEYKKNNILACCVYSNPTNYGTVKNLNTAIKISKGKYIAVLAGDDKFHDDSVLNKIVNRLKKSKTGVITCRRLKCDLEMKPLRYMPSDGHISVINSFDSHTKQHTAFIKGEYYEMASGSCTYYTREKLFKDGLFDERYRLLEDWTHFIQITRSEMIETAYDIVAVSYRDGGISTKMSPIIQNDYLSIIKEELDNNRKALSYWTRRCLKYNYMRIEKGNNIIPSIIYPDAFFARLIYVCKCKKYIKKGIWEYKSKNP